MTHDHDDSHSLTEADRTSQTRFGPRPVPKGHRRADTAGLSPARSSHIPPDSPQSPDGSEAWPTPSLTAKIIVWGGVGVAAAAATAGAIMATRKLAEAISGGGISQPVGRAAPAQPRRLSVPEDPQRGEPRPNPAPRTPRGPARGRNFAADLTETATGLSEGLNDVTRSLNQAFSGFRSVAEQANAIVGEFVRAADQIRGMKDRGDVQDQAAAHRHPDPEDARRHRL